MKPSAYISSFAVLAVYATLPGPFTNALNQARTSHSPAPKGSVTRTLSVYSDYYEGRTMSNGKKFYQHISVCATNDWPLGTWLKITANGKSIGLLVSDRMAKRFTGKRIDIGTNSWRYLTGGKRKPGLIKGATIEVMK